MINPEQFAQYRVLKKGKTEDEKKRDALFPGGFRESVLYHYELDSDRRKDGDG